MLLLEDTRVELDSSRARWTWLTRGGCTLAGRYLPEVEDSSLGGAVVPIDLNRPMAEVRQELAGCPGKTRLKLTGTLIVARDIAHAKLQERIEIAVYL